MVAVRRRGALGSKNIGTSNHNTGENPVRRKIKVSFATTIGEGLVGPKAMAKAAANGQSVNIPTLLLCLWRDGAQYVEHIIGFVFMVSECDVGKSASLTSM